MGQNTLPNTVPETLQMLSGEVRTITINMANMIGAGDVISSPSCVMQSNLVNETIPQSLGTPTVVGGAVKVTITAKYLRPGRTYSLVVTYTATGSGNKKVESIVLAVQIIR